MVRFIKQVRFKPRVKDGVMDEQSGKSEVQEEMMGKGTGESEIEELVPE